MEVLGWENVDTHEVFSVNNNFNSVNSKEYKAKMRASTYELTTHIGQDANLLEEFEVVSGVIWYD